MCFSHTDRVRSRCHTFFLHVLFGLVLPHVTGTPKTRSAWKAMIRSRDTNTLLALKRSGNVSQLSGKCSKDVRLAIKEEKVGSVTKVVTIENLPGDQLTITR